LLRDIFQAIISDDSKNKEYNGYKISLNLQQSSEREDTNV